jgi:ParB-like chromosome segregation protein Spo0J
MQVNKIPISQLNPAKYNPRKDLKPGDPEYKKLKRSMQEFGYVEPIVWNKRSGNIVGGHQRYKVLLDMGMSEVDCVVVDLDETKEKALNLALNKIQGDWDYEKLRDIINELEELGTDITLTGFDVEDVMQLNFERVGHKEKEEKNNPPTMRVVFENEQDFRKMEKDLRELIEEKYKRVKVSILGGEL